MCRSFFLCALMLLLFFVNNCAINGKNNKENFHERGNQKVHKPKLEMDKSMKIEYFYLKGFREGVEAKINKQPVVMMSFLPDDEFEEAYAKGFLKGVNVIVDYNLSQ